MKNVLAKIGTFFASLFGVLFGSRKDRVRNQNAFKHGTYAVVVCVLLVIALLAVNLLVSLLNERVGLEFDMTADKKNSTTQENRAFLESVDKDVTVYFLTASPEDYYGGYMEYYAEQNLYKAEQNDYYKQTVTLLEKYEEINPHITVRYVDPFGTEMSKLNTDYPNSYYYGDLLVVSQFTTDQGTEFNNSRLLNFTDIYKFTDKSGAAAYGYDYYTLSGSTLESQLTGAIASVISEDTRTVGFIAGHGGSEAFEYYRSLLEVNNFVVKDLDASVLNHIDESFDALVLCAPTVDFLGSELDALNDFLDNDGKKGKVLLVYGDTAFQNLPNLYEFFSEWGIGVDQGVVFETDDRFYISGEYSTFYSITPNNSEANEMGNKIMLPGSYYLTGYNLPIYENGKAYGGRETASLLTTVGSSVVAPIGTPKDQQVEGTAETFATCVMSTESTYYENTPVTSTVLVYSSVDFISQNYIVGHSSYADYKNLALRSLQIPTNMNQKTMSFDPKVITSTNDVYVVESSAADAVKWIFTLIVPVALLAVGVVVFFRRKAL